MMICKKRTFCGKMACTKAVTTFNFDFSSLTHVCYSDDNQVWYQTITCVWLCDWHMVIVKTSATVINSHILHKCLVSKQMFYFPPPHTMTQVIICKQFRDCKKLFNYLLCWMIWVNRSMELIKIMLLQWSLSLQNLNFPLW